MQKIFVSSFYTQLGELIIGSFNNKICLCDWKNRKSRKIIDNRINSGLNTYFEYFEDDLIKETKNQLDQYFCKSRRNFNIPILFVGTDFQKNVWSELLEIEYGSTRTYLELSMKLDNKKAIRAVAAANGANAISILVPCHRIIGSKGELIGYAGGIAAKKKLLEIEKNDSQKEINFK